MNTCVTALTYSACAFVFSARLDLVLVEDVPTVDGSIDAAEFAARLLQMRPDMAIVERPDGKLKGYSRAVHDPSQAFGTMLGILQVAAIPVEIVAPKSWRRELRIRGGAETDRAIDLWPARAELFARKRHAGRAAAALLAHHGASNMLDGGQW